MTEREMLKDLLDQPPTTTETAAQPLSLADELALLRAAEAAGPVTLASDPEPAQPERTAVQQVGAFVRRYPLQTALVAGAGVAAVALLRRRSA